MMKTDSQGFEPCSVSSLLDSNCDESESAATLSERPSAKRKNSDEITSEPFRDNSVEDAVGGQKRSRLETIRYTDEERERVVEILEREFNKELQARENEALLIEERIQRAQRTLHYLCYAVVSDFYSRDKTPSQQVTSTRQRRIHPAVKQLLAGKHPKDSNQSASTSTAQCHSSFDDTPPQEKTIRTAQKTKKNISPSNSSLECSSTSTSVSSTSNTVAKVPRYIPPKPKDSPGKSGGSSRGTHNKVKQRIVIGNVSKWLPSESREDSASHKWMVYVRGPKDAADVSGFVEKVRFFLHPSYRPNDVVEVVQPPFHLSRRGWGEFPVRVQIHFQDPLNKPVDVIHHLKLDRTCTGLQTLGAETIVDVWINKNNNYVRTTEQPELLVLSPVSQEFEEIFPKLEKDDEDIFGHLPTTPLSNSCSSLLDVIKTDIVTDSLLDNTQSNVSASSNNLPSTSKKTDVAISSILPREVCVSTPGILVSSPSKVKPSTPSVVQLQDTAAERVVLSTLKQASPARQQGPTPPIVSSSSPTKGQPLSTLVLSPSAAKPSVLSCVDSSKAVALNRSALVPNLTTTSVIKSDVVLSPSSTNATKMVTVLTTPNRLTETLPSNKTNTVVSSKLVQSPVKTVFTAGGILTSSGQVIKVLSPNKSLQNSATSVSSSPNTVVRTIAPKPIVAQNQNVVVRTPGNTARPISLVKYKAPDGSIRFLQVSQINQPNSKPVVAVNQSQIRAALPQNETRIVSSPTQLVVRPAGAVAVKPNVLTVQRNPSPLFRLPAPSNVAPIPNQRPVLMFRDGKVYLVRPSPTVNAAGTNQVAPTVRQPVLQTATNVPRPLILGNPHKQPTLQTVTNVPRQLIIGNPDIQPALQTGTNVPRQLIIGNPDKQPALPTVTNVPRQLIPGNPDKQPALPTVTNVPKQLVLGNLDNTEGTQFVTPGTIASAPPPEKTIRALPISKLMPEVLTQRPRGTQGSQRPGVSLLKSNVLQQSPLSSPNVSPINSPGSSPMHPSGKTISHRIILPRPTMSPVSASTYRTKLYKQMLSNVVRFCPTRSCSGGVGRAVRWILRNLPLIISEAKHPEYQVLHPYCAPDTNTFLNWNLGKQRACEFMRAQTVWKLLQDVGWVESELWTVREILIWARFHGYTIGLPLTDSGSDINSSVMEDLCNYSPIDAEISEWLDKEETACRTESVDVESSDEELDVVSANLSPSKIRIKQEPSQQTSNSLTDPEETMRLEEPLLGAGAFVNEVLNNVGVQLEPEQIVTGVKYPAAQRVLVQAVQSLVDDLVRRSLAKAWGRNISRSPRSVELPHVCSAILSRPEFDFLSCSGLGVNSVPSTSGGAPTSKMNPLNPS